MKRVHYWKPVAEHEVYKAFVHVRLVCFDVYAYLLEKVLTGDDVAHRIQKYKVYQADNVSCGESGQVEVCRRAHLGIQKHYDGEYVQNEADYACRQEHVRIHEYASVHYGKLVVHGEIHF